MRPQVTTAATPTASANLTPAPIKPQSPNSGSSSVSEEQAQPKPNQPRHQVLRRLSKKPSSYFMPTLSQEL